jgi:S-adenosylmethionine/arginine decarboxylase-like enzyme
MKKLIKIMEKFNPFHQHLIIKGYFLDAPKEVDVLNKWFVELVELVGMRVAAGPTSVYVTDLGNEGLTGTVTIYTSHSSIHIWDAETPSLFQFDIYSCKSFDIFDVIGKLNDFDLYSYEYILIDRNDRLELVSKGKSS